MTPRRPRSILLPVLLSRRSVLAASAALLSPARAEAAPSPFEIRRLSVPGKHATLFDLLIPKHLRPGEHVRLLVALHGLGESGAQEMGAGAWVERYGLGTAYSRLRSPPIERVSGRGEWTAGRLAEVNASLQSRPFGGLVIACPFTPSFRGAPDRARAIAEYGDWIVGELIPRARKEASADPTPEATAIDGCSMGGPYALDIFLRHPTAFGAFGVVQPAFGVHRAPGYASAIEAALAKHGRRSVHLLSSEQDAFRDSTRALASELEKRGVERTLRILPGPHDQPWLREAGTIEMLLFHERRPA